MTRDGRNTADGAAHPTAVSLPCPAPCADGVAGSFPRPVRRDLTPPSSEAGAASGAAAADCPVEGRGPPPWEPVGGPASRGTTTAAQDTAFRQRVWPHEGNEVPVYLRVERRWPRTPLSLIRWPGGGRAGQSQVRDVNAFSWWDNGA